MSAIPSIKNVDPEVARIIQPMKEVLDRFQGQLPKRPKIARLQTTATSAEVALKINEILELLQG